jgi:hypothetical protein
MGAGESSDQGWTGAAAAYSVRRHIHGSGKPNITRKTRISMDFQIADGMYGDLLGRKIPAGYFHVIPDTEEEEERLAPVPSWEMQFNNGNNTSSTSPTIPRRPIPYGASATLYVSCDYELFDLEDMLHCPTLWHLVRYRNANIVMYSIFASARRGTGPQPDLETALKRGNIIHFVNEDLQLVTAEDLETIKDYLEFSKYRRSRLPIGLPLSDLSRNYFNKWSASLAN